MGSMASQITSLTCLLSRLFGRRSKKTSKLRVTGLCAGNSPGIGEFPAQMGSKAEYVSIWWRHHDAMCPLRGSRPIGSIVFADSLVQICRQVICSNHGGRYVYYSISEDYALESMWRHQLMILVPGAGISSRD